MENQSMEKTKKPNVWLDYVKSMREKNPDKSYKEVLQMAKETYKPVEKKVLIKGKKQKLSVITSQKLDE